MPTMSIDSDEPIVVLKLSEYEALIETLEILCENPDIMQELQQARQDLKDGKGISYKEFFEKLRR